MLILKRKKNEKVMIGENMSVIVIDIDKQGVKLGFIIPKEISVYREEIYLKNYTVK